MNKVDKDISAEEEQLSLNDDKEYKNDTFYVAFEDKYRGSRKLIKERMSVYLPFILPLKAVYPSDMKALDIGCGRGEWLELLRENSIKANGVDLDKEMLKECHKRGFDIENTEGISYLEKQPNDSFAVISAFHVVEHISFESLQKLISESFRVLKPGGILILETPNPENIKVATENFYLDPTHIKPIPSSLLSFLAEFYGFARTKVLGLQEPKQLVQQGHVGLEDIIEGVSPDYAIVVQKDSDRKILKLFDKIFEKEFGLSLKQLTAKFESRLQYLEAKASQAEEKASQAEEKASQAEIKASQAEEKASQAAEKAILIEANYYALLNSRSWKITQPLREIARFARWFIIGVKHWITFSPTSRPRRVVKSILISFKHYINRHPRFKMKVLDILHYFPGLRTQIKKIMQTHQYTQNDSFIHNYQFNQSIPRDEGKHNLDIQRLSVDEILKRIELEVHKQEKKDA
jgi:O-antigen chain-terminating methyltransferase